MTILIKANNHAKLANVKNLYSLAPARAVYETKEVEDHAERDRSQDEIDHLKCEIERLQTELDVVKKNNEIKIEETHNNALDIGKQQALVDDKAKLDLLEKNINSVADDLSNNIQNLEKLSLAISEITLSKILGNTDNFKDILPDIINKQIADLSDKVVVKIFVSPQDFPHQNDLKTLSSLARNIDVEDDVSLTSGDCNIQLLLGHIDVGINNQRQLALQFLRELATE